MPCGYYLGPLPRCGWWRGVSPPGLPSDGPWDAIIIEGAVSAVPEIYAGQVAAGGRLVTVLAPTGVAGGRAILAEPVGVGGGQRLRSREMFDCSTPLLPGLSPAPSFVF